MKNKPPVVMTPPALEEPTSMRITMRIPTSLWKRIQKATRVARQRSSMGVGPSATKIVVRCLEAEDSPLWALENELGLDHVGLGTLADYEKDDDDEDTDPRPPRRRRTGGI